MKSKEKIIYQTVTDEDLNNAIEDANKLLKDSTIATALFDCHITLKILSVNIKDNIPEYKKWWLIEREIKTRHNL